MPKRGVHGPVNFFTDKNQPNTTIPVSINKTRWLITRLYSYRQIYCRNTLYRSDRGPFARRRLVVTYILLAQKKNTHYKQYMILYALNAFRQYGSENGRFRLKFLSGQPPQVDILHVIFPPYRRLRRRSIRLQVFLSTSNPLYLILIYNRTLRYTETGMHCFYWRSTNYLFARDAAAIRRQIRCYRLCRLC